MQKRFFCKDLVIGSCFEKEPFLLQTVGSEVNGQTGCYLSDRTGSIPCNVPVGLISKAELAGLTGKVVMVSAVVFAEKRQPVLILKSVEQTLDYLPSEVMPGLSKEKKAECIAGIKEVIRKIVTPSYRALVEACLSDENLEKLSMLPATHSYYGVYLGGALAATCTVTYMVMSAMASYSKRGNGITTSQPGWNVLLTASLLPAFGRIEYCDSADVFKKSTRGVSMNYFSTLQHSIESVIFHKNIDISEDELAPLLNVLAVSVSYRTDTKATSKDGCILRSILNLYGECDAIDYRMANHVGAEDEEYFYDRKLKRYLVVGEEE